MARIPEYPPMLTGNTQLDLRNLREYLVRQVQDQIRAEQEAEKNTFADAQQGGTGIND